MTLIKYNRPNRDIFSKSFSDIMDEFFNDVVNTRRTGSFVPDIDISERDDQFLVSVELPGVEKEDIEINLDNGRLTISGERKFENEEEGKTYHRVETRYGKFSRSFQLPDNVDEESIKAKYENGLLNLTLNKTEDKAKKQIKIN